MDNQKMFIRTKTTPNSPRKSIQIVESIRDGNKIKQKIVHHVGIALDEREEQKLRDYGMELIAKIILQREAESAQIILINSTEEDIINGLKSRSGQLKTKQIQDILPTSQVTLDDIIEEKRIIEGVHDIAGVVFDDIYSTLPIGKRTYQILKNIVLSRLINPCSKRKSQQKIAKNFDQYDSLEMIYWMMDQIFPKIDQIKRATFMHTQSLFPQKIDLLLFDVTTLYFESINEDELRKYGYSKDHRFNTTQVVLALATNQDGLPIGYELFSGNTAEVTTLVTAIESWKECFDIGLVCFVGDRAMFSKNNIELFESLNYKYIIAAKLKSLSNNIIEEIFDEQNYRTTILKQELSWIGEFNYTLCGCSLFQLSEIPQINNWPQIFNETSYAYAWINKEFYYLSKPDKLILHIQTTPEQLLKLMQLTKSKKIITNTITKRLIKLLKPEQLATITKITNHKINGRLIVSYKSKRAMQDQKNRQRIIDKIQKTLIGKKTAKKLITNKGVKKFVTVDNTATAALDADKIAYDMQWDGLHGIITNIYDETPESLIGRYAKLWIIEESFRINKHTLQMRPIFHWAPNRIHTHIAICYMTFSVLRHMQYKINLTKKISIDSILDELMNVQASIYIHKHTKDRYRVPSYYSNNARKIYKLFNINRSVDAEIYRK